MIVRAFHTPDPIGAYLIELRHSLRNQADVEDLVAESEDHLREAVAKQLIGGIDPVRAQQLVLTQFGEPRLVANALVRSRTRTLPEPSAFSVLAGRTGIAAALGWLASLAATYWSATKPSWQPDDYLWVQATAGISTALTALLILGLIARAGALRTISSAVSVVLLAFALAGNAQLTWMWPISNLFIAAALTVGIGLGRQAQVPGLTSGWAFSGALIWPLATGVAIAGRSLGIGPLDEWGEYSQLTNLALPVACIGFAGVCGWLGLLLARETVPPDLQRSSGWVEIVTPDTKAAETVSSRGPQPATLTRSATATELEQPPAPSVWAPPN